MKLNRWFAFRKQVCISKRLSDYIVQIIEHKENLKMRTVKPLRTLSMLLVLALVSLTSLDKLRQPYMGWHDSVGNVEAKASFDAGLELDQFKSHPYYGRLTPK